MLLCRVCCVRVLCACAVCVCCVRVLCACAAREQVWEQRGHLRATALKQASAAAAAAAAAGGGGGGEGVAPWPIAKWEDGIGRSGGGYSLGAGGYAGGGSSYALGGHALSRHHNQADMQEARCDIYVPCCAMLCYAVLCCAV
jgi:hypothetical protein